MFGRGKHADSKLMEATWAGQVDDVRQVLMSKADLINAPAAKSLSRSHDHVREGDTALHVAAAAGHRAVVELLLSLKASVRVTSSSGATPLHYASAAGHHGITALLLERGADPNAHDAKGRAPMHAAARAGHPQVHQVLVSAKADVNARDQEGNTPLHEAARACAEPLARLLVQAGADVNTKNKQDRTPLHVAVISADHSASSYINPQQGERRQATAQMVKLLLELGADANVVDALGETPLDLLSYLEGEGATDPLVEILRSAGGLWERYKHRHQDEPQPAPVAEETIAGARMNRRKDSRPATPALTATGLDPIKLGSTPITIGRSTECDVRYRSLTLSRRHARIEPQGDGYVVTDLGSHNGTQVDGEKISAPYLLEPEESITVGAYEFGFDGSRLIPRHGELSHDELAKERRHDR